MLPQKFDIDYCWRAFLRRKWYVVVPFCLIFSAGIGYALTRTKMYKSSATILVQRQSLPTAYVRSTITANTRERINTIRAKVTSRTNLEDLITEFELYTSDDPSEPGINMGKKITTMRSNIGFLIPRVGQSFSISFTHSNPRKAMEVINALVLDFIQENRLQKKDESVGTTEFLGGELQRVETLLEERELALTTYKQAHMGGLPEQLSTNLAMRGQLLQKIESIERSLDQANSQKIMLQGQISTFKSVVGFDPLISLEPDNGITSSSELIKLKEELRNLRLRYTKNHPDVIKLRRKIALLEEEQEAPSANEETAVANDIAPTSGGLVDTQFSGLELQLASIDQTIKDLRAQKLKIEQENRRLDKLIADTPKGKLDLINLERDYNAIKQQYNSLLSKKLDSDLVTSMEKQEKGTGFKVTSPANRPTKPVSPNIPRIILMAALAGLAVGFGLALGMEYIDQSFRDYKELGEFLQLPVLAVIPQLETTVEADRRKRFKLIAFCVTGVLLAVVGIGVWLWMNGNLQELVQKIRSIAAT
jgi:polysaccharide chain length determinant protein (PEP-CTERM system associated)